jgi:hypothetical protein
MQSTQEILDTIQQAKIYLLTLFVNCAVSASLEKLN